MRTVFTWLTTCVAIVAWTAPSHAADLTVSATPSSSWAGTQLKLSAQRASSGRLRVHLEGTVATSAPGPVALSVSGCTSAGTNPVSSYGWTPEHHPAGRQAVPDDPVFESEEAGRFALRGRGKQHVSYSVVARTVGYASPAALRWTDCVHLGLARTAKDGGDHDPAFDLKASTLFVTVTLPDGRHVPCGPAPAFCYPRMPDEPIPPALPTAPCPGCGPPAFPPAPGYPGSPGVGDLGPGASGYYHVCGTPENGGPYLCDGKDAAALTPRSVPLA